MLKYNVEYSKSGDDFIEIRYDSFVLEASPLVTDNEYLVTFRCPDDIPLEIGQTVNVNCDYKTEDDVLGLNDSMLEHFTARVVKVDHIDYTFSIAIDRLKQIERPKTVEEYEEDGVVYWEFLFDEIHGFLPTDINISIVLRRSGIYSNVIEGLEYVNSYRLKWVYNPYYPNISEISDLLFTNRMIGVSFYREQFVFQENSESTQYNFNLSLPTVTLEKPKMTLRIPINVKSDVTLLKENIINSVFVENSVENAINGVVDMEKIPYTPVIINSKSEYLNIRRINFNLHLREHSGENWTVKTEDTWNCFKLFNGSSPDETFYPYSNNNNQSDLLGCLGFTNKDVKYQKNTLKKSFLRLSYYDSMNEGNQNLLAYSVLYFDTANLYSKYLYTHNLPIYVNRSFEADGGGYEILTGGKVDNEVKRSELLKYINIDSDETVEKYRISSQISVENKWLSKRTSEGFYVYLWTDNDNGVIPTDLYMQVELNHAGFGRTIPFMLPYNSPGSNGVGSCKTMSQIRYDWENGQGYTNDAYRSYSYVKLKYLYDKDQNRHIYYLDPERYGYWQGDILNINLYEARISFGQ